MAPVNTPVDAGGTPVAQAVAVVPSLTTKALKSVLVAFVADTERPTVAVDEEHQQYL